MANVTVRKATKTLEQRGKGVTIETIRVAAYVRVSTDSKEQLESYNSQVKHYTEYIASKPEWQLVEIFADEAITGTKTVKRDEFHRMISEALKGNIDLIIVKSISRFARNTVDTLNYVRMLKDKNVAVLFEEENIHTLTMDGELLLTILGAVAQQEVQNTSEHVKRGIDMKMQRGEMVGFNGCIGYDYNREDKSISVNKKEAEIVRYIFKRYVEGAGGDMIAQELKDKGYRNKKGNLNWSATGVLGVIKNEKYVGDLLMGKTFTVDPISKRRLYNMGEVNQYYTENHHEAIVSREIFDMAQKIRERRNGARKCGRQEKFSRQYAFSSMLHCGFCGGLLSRRAWNSKTDYSKTIWHCVTATKHGKKNCPYCKGIEEEVIEKAFVQSYNLLCKENEGIVNNFLERIEKSLKKDDNSSKIKKVETEIARLKGRKSTLVDMRLDDKIDEETYRLKMQEIEDNIGMLNGKLQEYSQTKDMQTDINKRLRQFKEVIQNKELLEKFDRHVFECIIDRVIVGETGEDGTKYPYTLTFIYKTGKEDKVATKQPKSSTKACSHTKHELHNTCLQPTNMTLRVCGVDDKIDYVI